MIRNVTGIVQKIARAILQSKNARQIQIRVKMCIRDRLREEVYAALMQLTAAACGRASGAA